jgi:hypothetical protein
MAKKVTNIDNSKIKAYGTEDGIELTVDGQNYLISFDTSLTMVDHIRKANDEYVKKFSARKHRESL